MIRLRFPRSVSKTIGIRSSIEHPIVRKCSSSTATDTINQGAQPATSETISDNATRSESPATTGQVKLKTRSMKDLRTTITISAIR